MAVDEVSPQRLAVLLSDSRVVEAALELRRLVDERKAPRGAWVDGNFKLAHTCSGCGVSKKVAMIIHGKEPGHLASVYGAPDKGDDVADLAKVFKRQPEFKNPNVVRSWIAAQAARDAIAEISQIPVP